MSTKSKDLSKVPTQLRAHVERLSKMHATLLEGAMSVIFGSDQPMSAAEVRFRTEKLLGRSVDIASMTSLLDELVAKKKLSSRVETMAERAIRAGGRSPKGRCGKLYFAGAKVPPRTQRFDDIALGDGKATSESQRRYKETQALKKKRKQARSKKAGSSKRPVQTGTKSGADAVAAVRALADERAARAKRVAQLEDTLARINRLFTSN